MGYAVAMAKKNTTPEQESLLGSVRRLTGQMAGSTLGLARNTAAMTAMFGENWLRSTVLNQLEEAVAAGRLPKDRIEESVRRVVTLMSSGACTPS